MDANSTRRFSRAFPCPTCGGGGYTLDDLAFAARAARNRAYRTIDEATPVGQYVRALERSYAELEDRYRDLGLAYRIALDERSRAERRNGELESAIDVLSSILGERRAA